MIYGKDYSESSPATKMQDLKIKTEPWELKKKIYKSSRGVIQTPSLSNRNDSDELPPVNECQIERRDKSKLPQFIKFIYFLDIKG